MMNEKSRAYLLVKSSISFLFNYSLSLIGLFVAPFSYSFGNILVYLQFAEILLWAKCPLV